MVEATAKYTLAYGGSTVAQWLSEQVWSGRWTTVRCGH